MKYHIYSSLAPDKAHDHGMMSIRMLKLCGDSIYKPLLRTYLQSLLREIGKGQRCSYS